MYFYEAQIKLAKRLKSSLLSKELIFSLSSRTQSQNFH